MALLEVGHSLREEIMAVERKRVDAMVAEDIPMLMAGVGALILAPIVTWLSPLARMREMPSPQEPVLTESVTEERAGD